MSNTFFCYHCKSELSAVRYSLPDFIDIAYETINKEDRIIRRLQLQDKNDDSLVICYICGLATDRWESVNLIEEAKEKKKNLKVNIHEIPLNYDVDKKLSELLEKEQSKLSEFKNGRKQKVEGKHSN